MSKQFKNTNAHTEHGQKHAQQNHAGKQVNVGDTHGKGQKQAQSAGKTSEKSAWNKEAWNKEAGEKHKWKQEKRNETSGDDESE